MSEPQWRIGSHALPSALVKAVGDGRWRPPSDEAIFVDVFGEEPDGPQFYDYPTMVRQNQSFQQMAPEGAFSPDGDEPGIEPASAVLIGDLGADMPIALDYRKSNVEPRVLYLASSGWVEVASNVEGLLVALKL